MSAAPTPDIEQTDDREGILATMVAAGVPVTPIRNNGTHVYSFSHEEHLYLVAQKADGKFRCLRWNKDSGLTKDTMLEYVRQSVGPERYVCKSIRKSDVGAAN